MALLSQIAMFPRGEGVNAVVSTILYASATLVFVVGNLKRVGLRPAWLFNASVTVLVVAFIAYFYYGILWLHARIYVENFGLATLIIVAAVRIIRKTHSFLDRALGWTLFVFAAQIFLRTILTIGHHGFRGQQLHREDLISYTQSPFWLWMHLSFLVFTVLIGLLLAAVIAADIVTALHKKAITDSLTNLLNRRGFEELAGNLASRGNCLRQSLVMLDIDDFKAINDIHGHHAGDVVLEQIGELIRDHVRPEDAAARIGGEEFAVLLCDLDRNKVHELAESLRYAIAAKQFGFGLLKNRTVTASFGIVELQPEDTLQEALLRADDLLYAAKRTGKNKIAARTV